MSETLTLGVALLTSGGLLSLAVCAALAAAVVMRLRWPQTRGTTLAAVAVWGGISLIALIGTELAIALLGTPPWAAAARYAAAMSTFCPIVALLGAKRPQDRGWQWIVLTLWAILCQPAAEWLLFGGVAEIHPARFWFLMILVAVGATNGIGTRNAPASLLYAAGQWSLLTPYFSPAAQSWATACAAAGIWLTLAGWCVLTWNARRAPRAGGLDGAWLDFRDAYGVVWALRIQERMNTSSRMYDWPVKLDWHGFRTRPSETHAEPPAVVEDSFRTLLRRFVSPAWIDARLHRAAANTAHEPTLSA